MSNDNEGAPSQEAAKATLITGMTSMVAHQFPHAMPSDASAVVSTGVATTVVTLALAYKGALTNRAVRRAKELGHELVLACRVSSGALDVDADAHAAAEAEVSAKLNAPESEDALIESMRAALDAIDDAAIPCIARLLHYYTSRGEQPDRFFRVMARLLCECDACDLEDLRRTFVLATSTSRAAGTEVAVEVLSVTKVARLVYVRVSGVNATGSNCVVRSAARITHLLSAHGLGEPSPVLEAVSCTVSRATIDSVLRVLGETLPEQPGGPIP